MVGGVGAARYVSGGKCVKWKVWVVEGRGGRRCGRWKVWVIKGLGV